MPTTPAKVAALGKVLKAVDVVTFEHALTVAERRNVRRYFEGSQTCAEFDRLTPAEQAAVDYVPEVVARTAAKQVPANLRQAEERYVVYRIDDETSVCYGEVGYAIGRLPRGTTKLGVAYSPEEAQRLVSAAQAKGE